MRYTLLLITLCVQYLCNAQYNPKDYTSIPYEKKELVFIDEFTDSSSDWGDTMTAIKETSWSDYDFVNGEFVYNNDKGDKGLCKNVPIDYNRNFEIIIRINVSGENWPSGIFAWGRIDELKTANYFIMVQDGSLEIFNCNKHTHGGACPSKSKKARSRRFSDITYNIYTIRKYDREYYIFSNGAFIKKAPYYPLSGNYICMGASENSTIKVDYLKIYYLP